MEYQESQLTRLVGNIWFNLSDKFDCFVVSHFIFIEMTLVQIIKLKKKQMNDSRKKIEFEF